MDISDDEIEMLDLNVGQKRLNERPPSDELTSDTKR